MGPGKAELLVAIDATGSIVAAGRKLGFSYQKTRRLLDEMNVCFESPLVEGFKGGVHGGGARITMKGREVLDRYQAMVNRAEAAVVEELEDFRKLLAR